MKTENQAGGNRDLKPGSRPLFYFFVSDRTAVLEQAPREVESDGQSMQSVIGEEESSCL